MVAVILTGGCLSGSFDDDRSDMAFEPPDLSMRQEDVFATQVMPILINNCTFCHAVTTGAVANAPQFLAGENGDTAAAAVLKTVLDKNLWPGVVGTSPETSLLVQKGQHTGPAFQATDKAVVSNWIVLYNEQLNAPKYDDM